MASKYYFFLFVTLLVTSASYSQSGILSTQELIPNADLQADSQYGKSIKIDGDYMVVGAPFSTINYSREGVVYVYKFESTWGLVATLTSPNPTESGFFGFDVDISGDFIVVGAYNENFYSDNTEYGNAYLFEKPSEGWADSNGGTRLLTSTPKVNSFGYSVAIDGASLVISTNGTGEVFLYNKDAGTWNIQQELAILTTSDLLTGDGFGISLDIKGDLVLVGAPYHDVFASEDGSVYLFDKPISGWVDMTETAKLTSISADHNNNFGSSVSIGEDYVVVGSPREDGGGWGIGAAYIYNMPVDGWVTTTESAKLTASDGDLEFRVGVEVEANGDFVYVGANYKNRNGSVYVFSKTAGVWENSEEIFKITYPSGASKSYFGYSIASRGNQLLLGDLENRGSIDIYETTNGNWDDLAHISQLTHALETSSWDRFGEAVAIDGNIAVIGVSGDDFVNNNAGIVYVFELINGSWQKIARLSVSDGKSSDFMGRSVDIKGNLIIVGAPKAYDPINNRNFAGAVYSYVKPESGWVDMVESQKITEPDPGVNKYFGSSVAIGFDFIVIGQNGASSLGADGRIYIFDMDENSLISPDGRLIIEEVEAGFKVKSDSNVVVASQQRGRNGSVTIIEKDENNSWEAPVITELYNGSGSFGYNVDISGNTIAVSSPVPYNDNGIQSGVYMFTKKTEKWSDLDMDTIVYENPEPDNFYLFGGDVALSSNHLLISADYGSYWDKDSSQVWRVRREGEFWSNQDSIIKLRNENLDYIEGHFNNPLAVDGNTAFVGSFKEDVLIEDNSGVVYAYDLEAPVGSIHSKNYLSDSLYSFSMVLSEPIANLDDLMNSTFETELSKVSSIIVVNDQEIILELELNDPDSFSIMLPSNQIYDVDGNPNYSVSVGIVSPRVTFKTKEYVNGRKYFLSMILNKSGVVSENLNTSSFETLNCNMISLAKENDQEFTIELEIIENDSFSIKIASNVLYDIDGNPNRSSRFSDLPIILGYSDNKNIDFVYHPNPVLDKLNLEFKNSISRSIIITNSLGIRKSIEITSGKAIELDFQDYAIGVYFVEIISAREYQRMKILKLAN